MLKDMWDIFQDILKTVTTTWVDLKRIHSATIYISGTTTTFKNAKRKRSDSIVANKKLVIQVFFDKNYNEELSQHFRPRSLDGNNKTIVSNIRQYALHMNSKVIMFPLIKRIWLSYKLYNFQYCYSAYGRLHHAT